MADVTGGSFHQSGQAGHFAGRQVVGHDHVTGAGHGAEHLVEVGGEHLSVDGPAHGHRRLQPARSQGGHQRRIRSAVQGCV